VPYPLSVAVFHIIENQLIKLATTSLPREDACSTEHVLVVYALGSGLSLYTHSRAERLQRMTRSTVSQWALTDSGRLYTIHL